MWAVKHKSGTVLFVTNCERTANNRREMGWTVNETECQHEWVSKGSYPDIYYVCMWCGECADDENDE